MELSKAMQCHIQGKHLVLITCCHARAPKCTQKAPLLKVPLVGLQFSFKKIHIFIYAIEKTQTKYTDIENICSI